MPRPTSKATLVAASGTQYEKLWKLIDSMSLEEQNSQFMFEDRDKNLRDVIVHLHEWHKMTEKWHRVGVLEGAIPDVPGKGYTWRTLPELNLVIWRKYQTASLDSAKNMFIESHKMISDLIETHSDDELFSKNVYKWTKSSTLGAYFIGATSSHYEWAMKKLKKHIKLFQDKSVIIG